MSVLIITDHHELVGGGGNPWPPLANQRLTTLGIPPNSITLCTMYCVLCILYTVYSVLCTLCTLYSVHCVLCTLYSVYSVLCTLYTVYSVLCVLCTLCTLYSVYSVLYVRTIPASNHHIPKLLALPSYPDWPGYEGTCPRL